MHADKHESFRQIDIMIFGGDGQAFPKVPGLILGTYCLRYSHAVWILFGIFIPHKRQICMLPRGGSSSNCSKFTKICSFLLTARMPCLSKICLDSQNKKFAISLQVRDEVNFFMQFSASWFQSFGYQIYLKSDTVIIEGHDQAFSKYSK